MFRAYQEKNEYSFYEVEEGSIAKQNSHRGIILRNETVYSAETTGYVNFYASDTQKAAMNSRLYSIDENGDLKKFLTEHSEETKQLSSALRKTLHKELIQESRNFDPQNFSEAYLLREELETKVLGLSDSDKLSRYADEISANGIRFNEYRADRTGIVSYSIDGYEGKTKTDICSDDFEQTGYNCSRLQANTLITAGTPVCKIITSESWEIIFKPSEDEIADLTDKTSLKVSFRNHDLRITAGFELFENSSGETMGCLTFSKYLIRFLNDRFVEFSIETDNVSGLKIPEKSVTSKDFYKIPLSLKKKDERGNAGVFKTNADSGETVYTFIVTEVYAEDDSYCYINLPDSGNLQPGDCIGDPGNTSLNYRIGEVKSLPGVYNINKGYAVFKQIEELDRANGYCIVKKNTPFGLSVYDHIILDASAVEEGQVLY